MDSVTAWPLFGLRLRTERLVLRAATELDTAELATRLPDDVELDPTLPSVLEDRAADRAGRAMRFYWRTLATFAPEHWRLSFVVSVDGVDVGMQDVDAEEFPSRRAVDTSSWLFEQWRGRGIGKEMRTAVLALAFDHLGAEFAHSQAWSENMASLAVSRALGYTANGFDVRPRRGQPAIQDRLVLDRAAWGARERPPVSVTGLDAALPLLGLRNTPP